MDVEEEFLSKLIAIFHVEAEEHLKALSAGLLALEGELAPEARQNTLESIYREAHSLKGAARSVNMRSIQDICQALESVLSAWKQGTLIATPTLFDRLHSSLDAITNALITPSDLQSTQNIIKLLEKLLTETPPETSLEAVTPHIEQMIQRETTEAQKAKVATSSAPQSEKTVRIGLDKLDRLFQEAEEMLMVKLMSQQEATDLKQLSNEFRTHKKEFATLLSESQSIKLSLQKNGVQAKQIKEQEKILELLMQQQQKMKVFDDSLNKLVKTSDENTHFIGALVDTLLEDVKKVLMQPISTLLEVMPRMVRDIARELNKEIHMESQGGDIEVDRRILEEIKDPLLHLLRNAMDHGIELPDARIKKGKPKTGTIRIIAAETSGGHVELVITDDGQGFDIERLKAAAISNKRLTSQEAKELTHEDALKLAFCSGLSTSRTLTELSGRGLGLGIVSEKVDALGGRIVIDSKADQGSTFKLILPLTLATFRGIHISVASREFIMPAHYVTRILRFKRHEIKTIENCEVISVDGHTYSFVHLANLLNIPTTESNGETIFAIIVKSEEKTIALGADAIHREHEVLVKGLGAMCLRVKNVMAATIMEWGKVIPILNPIDLVRLAVRGDVLPFHASSATVTAKNKKIILVAEDSITTRLLLRNILESAGYAVETASDGMDAYEILKTKDIDLLLTDVEMPRMDGFALTERVRSSEALKNLPVIICTSRGSNEDRERGIELGADAYLDKSSFTQNALLNATQRLL